MEWSGWSDVLRGTPRGRRRAATLRQSDPAFRRRSRGDAPRAIFLRVRLPAALTGARCAFASSVAVQSSGSERGERHPTRGSPRSLGSSWPDRGSCVPGRTLAATCLSRFGRRCCSRRRLGVVWSERCPTLLFAPGSWSGLDGSMCSAGPLAGGGEPLPFVSLIPRFSAALAATLRGPYSSGYASPPP